MDVNLRPLLPHTDFIPMLPDLTMSPAKFMLASIVLAAAQDLSELKAVKVQSKYAPDVQDDPEASQDGARLCDLPADWPSTSDEDVLIAYLDCLATRCHNVDARIFDDAGDIGCDAVLASGVPCESTVPGSAFPLSFLCPAICDACVETIVRCSDEGSECTASAATSSPPLRCAAAPCTEEECCEPRGQCGSYECAAPGVPRASPPAYCASASCEEGECCEVFEWPFQVAPASVGPPRGAPSVGPSSDVASTEAPSAGPSFGPMDAVVGDDMFVEGLAHLTLEFADAAAFRVGSESAGGLSSYEGVPGVVRCGQDESFVLVFLVDARGIPAGATSYECAGACAEQDWSAPMRIHRINCGPLGNDNSEARRAFMTRAVAAAS